MILTNLYDRNNVFDNGPYFFNSAGLYLRYWVERFNPDKESFTYAPVWIWLYLLPHEYWDAVTIQAIGNVLGTFIHASEITRIGSYTSYARFYIYMNISKALPSSIYLTHEDLD